MLPGVPLDTGGRGLCIVPARKIGALAGVPPYFLGRSWAGKVVKPDFKKRYLFLGLEVQRKYGNHEAQAP